MYEWVTYQGYRPVIIATKADKIKRSQLEKHKKMLRETLGLKPGDVLIPFSSVSKQGLDDVYALIEEYTDPALSEQ